VGLELQSEDSVQTGTQIPGSAGLGVVCWQIWLCWGQQEDPWHIGSQYAKQLPASPWLTQIESNGQSSCVQSWVQTALLAEHFSPLAHPLWHPDPMSPLSMASSGIRAPC
jgi:hypothetical protein